MTQHTRPLPPAKLLERVLRVAELLALPAKPECLPPTTSPDSSLPEGETPPENAAKTVKHRFQVK
jgi:hypothetical protein